VAVGKSDRHMERTENIMFEFRIITCENGNQVIDRNVKTPYEALTPVQMLDYLDMDAQLAFMDRIERKSRVDADRQRKRTRNPLYRLACLCGMI